MSDTRDEATGRPVPVTQHVSTDDIIRCTMQHLPGYRHREGFERYHEARMREASVEELEEALAWKRARGVAGQPRRNE